MERGSDGLYRYTIAQQFKPPFTPCRTRTQLHLEHTKHGVVRHEIQSTTVRDGNRK